jgi:hypothetical protein
MTNPPRKLAFILASTEHGAMIVNRFDEFRRPDNSGFGIGYAAYDPADVTLLLTLLDLRRRCYGDGIVAIDCGANIGVHSVEWARHMTGWGIVIAIEAQERIYYALAGNLALAGKLRAWLEELDYSVLQSGINLLAIHKEDECLKHLKIEQQKSA